MNANYNNNLLLQQQQQQHQNPQQSGQQPQQQQQAPSLQPDQAMNQNNMDPARLQQWAQMHYGQNAAADMNHAKVSPPDWSHALPVSSIDADLHLSFRGSPLLSRSNHSICTPLSIAAMLTSPSTSC
jgi:hypothetical protein